MLLSRLWGCDMSDKKDASSKQEHMIASYLGWSVVPGSGSRACRPGDIQSDQWLGECKTHTKPVSRYTFVQTVWNKLSDEAASRFKYAVLFVDDGTQKIDHTWCLLRFNAISWSDVYASSAVANWFACNKKFNTNIVISSEELSKLYSEAGQTSDTAGLRIHHANNDFLLSSLPLFREICQAMGWS